MGFDCCASHSRDLTLAHTGPSRHFLRELREKQTAIKLFDETAAEVVKEAARK